MCDDLGLQEPFTHESLLIDRKELRMSRKEKMQAKEGYARDKRMNITYSRPSYAAYYPGGSAGQQYVIVCSSPGEGSRNKND